MWVRFSFKPFMPYFFGNERRFAFSGEKDRIKNSYFIQSESLPLQSTLFGAVRWLLLPYKDYEEVHKAENARYVGKNSFDPDAEGGEQNDFGMIRQISPLYLWDGARSFVPVPFDSCSDQSYQPLQGYERINTSEGEKLYSDSFNVKLYVPKVFISVEDGTVITESVFSKHTRVGINRQNTEKGFFRKTYIGLEKRYAFAVNAELNDAVDLGSIPKVVFLGQGHTPFAVSIERISEKKADLAGQASDRLSRDSGYYGVYCLSDTLVRQEPLQGDGTNTPSIRETPYVNTLFAIVKVREYRSFLSKGNGFVKSGEVLHHLMQSGSFFLFDSPEMANQWMDRYGNKAAQQIGMNHFVKLWKER